MSEPQSSLWAFSVSVYANAAVHAECLDLQDRHSIDVNLLLFCAYVGAVHGAVLSDTEVRQAASIVGEWHSSIVKRLLEARRALKPFATELSPIGSSAATLRTSVKATELEAERLEQMMLEGWSTLRVEAWPRAQPAEAIAANLRALFAICGGSAQRAELPTHLVAAALAVAC
jgi:uncharacterized protein (TIGR02444 family)